MVIFQNKPNVNLFLLSYSISLFYRYSDLNILFICWTSEPPITDSSVLCVSVFVVIVIVLLRYAHVIEKHQNGVLNTASLSMGWISAAGLIMVGNFQVRWIILFSKLKEKQFMVAGIVKISDILIIAQGNKIWQGKQNDSLCEQWPWVTVNHQSI